MINLSVFSWHFINFFIIKKKKTINILWVVQLLYVLNVYHSTLQTKTSNTLATKNNSLVFNWKHIYQEIKTQILKGKTNWKNYGGYSRTDNWATEKIYEWSITLSLKMCLFRCLQISLTNTIQIVPKLN